MKFYIKNNNIYYYNFPLLNGVISYLLFIIYAIFLLYKISYIKYFNYISIFVGLHGIIDTFIKFSRYKLFLILILSILGQIIFLYPLTNFKKYMQPNTINYILSLKGILTILFLPYWPYSISKEKTIASLILVNIFFTYYYYFHYNV
tara:strand:- start:3239 stop:3679 length:441 start_codon:yes stop_codon:yes gene_type:complete